MKRFAILLTFATAMYAGAKAQSTEDSVKAAVNRLFEGMKTADAALLKSAFADSSILQTIAHDKEGHFYIRNEKLSDFADFVAKQKKGAADERIVFETIRIDGPLASVWTPYRFYYKGQLIHCGVNSFQLVRLNGEWKIQYLIDTRRKIKCAD
jgi:hypothetical protein